MSQIFVLVFSFLFYDKKRVTFYIFFRNIFIKNEPGPISEI